MRSVYTLAFVGFISFTGLTAHAQPGGAGMSMDAMIQMLTGGGGAGTAFDQIMAEVTGQPTDTSVPIGPTIEGPLAVETVVPEVNQAVVEIIDTRTGRYPPRLTINFDAFPLRSLAETTYPNNGRNGRNGRNGQVATQAEIVAQRIQSRLRVPEFQLTVEDRTAVISGTVATERERSLIESMLRFEPGISRIQNEIAVVP